MAWTYLTPEEAARHPSYGVHARGMSPARGFSWLVCAHTVVLLEFAFLVLTLLDPPDEPFERGFGLEYMAVNSFAALALVPFLAFAHFKHRLTPLSGVIGMWLRTLIPSAYYAGWVIPFRVNTGIYILIGTYWVLTIAITLILQFSAHVNVTYLHRVRA